MPDLKRIASIDDMRALARKRLPRSIFEFIDGGAGAGTTAARNMTDFSKHQLLPRCSIDVSVRSSTTHIVGFESKLPLILAPTGFAGLFWPKGEIAAASAAADAGIPFCLSTNSVCSIEEVANAVPAGDRWFQLYFLKDQALMSSMLARAKASGYRVLCLTLDLPVQGRRDNDIRNAFTVPLKPRFSTAFEVAMRPGWALRALRGDVKFGNFQDDVASGGFMSIAQRVASLCDASADWSSVSRLVEEWGGPVVLKGILNPLDVSKAIEVGADAIIVSNHGGRQLDHVPSAIDALPAVIEAAGGGIPVILDGGVRRGTDIAIAMALGASACMIGRPFLWGLASNGERGVARSIEIFREELDTALAILGVTRVTDLSKQPLQPQ
ncbi:MAG TPA: alpha-hydroxy acid oxidase [Paracoccaceae bacterium]|nr:alpha-hydroxy acid oxidase [Paracoccaceae bacterium]